MHAVHSGKIEVLDLMLRSGCFPYQVNNNLMSALDLAKHLKNRGHLIPYIEFAVSKWIGHLGKEEYERRVDAELHEAKLRISYRPTF